ncbi:MAG TPA: VIT domain-containing protein [Planktothrix sp.]|jgi:Ca-activated chloride channel family protein
MPTPATEKLPICGNDKVLRSLGALCVERKEGKTALPLAGVDIKADVLSRIASVTVKQKFQNPYKDLLEAVYIFPLSGGCAVSKFEMRVKDRVVVGKVDERQQARQDYELALAQGKRAALMEQERDDVFTMQLGNLPPGEEVEITVVYSERLPYFESGKTELRLPLVIGHRYIPGNPINGAAVGDGIAEDTDVVSDASRITPPRLAPGVVADLTLSIAVNISTKDEAVSDITCSQHATSTSIDSDNLQITLSREDEVMDRDFVLTWRLANAEIAPRMYIYKGESESFGMLSIVPPRIDGFVGPARDIVFVIDRSGSMRGMKMSSAARSCSILLETLAPRDRFTILAFDNASEWMGGRSTPSFYDADEDGLERGHKFLRSIDARGGTELKSALEASMNALKMRNDTEARLPIIVLLTDGEVGDEARILRSLQENQGDIRMFTIGVDTAPNSGLLKRLAQIGGGTVSFVQPGTQLEKALMNVGREIGVPLVTDIAIECKTNGVSLVDVAPSPVPDLFVGRAVSVFFRLSKFDGKAEITIKGDNADKTKFSSTVKTVEATSDAIAQLWAKNFVTSLEDQYRCESGAKQQQLKQQIVEIAKKHSLLTKFTAFIVIDESEIVNKDGSRRKVVQPVSEPSGWELNQTQSLFGAAPAAAFGSPQLMRSAAPTDAWECPAPVEAWGSAPSMPQSPPYAGAPPNTLAESITRKVSEVTRMRYGAPSTPAQPAPPVAGGGGGGFFSKAMNKLRGGSGGNSPTGLPPQLDDADFEATHAGKPGEVEQKVIEALAQFTKALAAVWADIEAGKTPEKDALTSSRDALFAALAVYDRASELPHLQRFLRVQVASLVAALNSTNTTADDWKKLRLESASVFKAVEEEATKVLNVDAHTGAASRFWDSSI